MVLSCPHCRTNTAFSRGDFFGSWVVCKQCEWPFAWRKQSEPTESVEDQKTETAVPPTGRLQPASSAAGRDHDHGKADR